MSRSRSGSLRRSRFGAAPFLRAARLARPFRGHIAAAALATMVLAALQAAEPLLLKHIFDRIGAPDAAKALLAGALLLLGIGVARELGDAVANWLVWRTRLGIHERLLEETVTRLHHLPLEYYRKDAVGGVLTRLDRSIQGLVEAVTKVLFHAFPAVVYLVLAVLVMTRLDGRLAALVLLFAPLPALLQAHAAPNQIRRERALLTRWASIYSRFGEVLAGIVTVRSFGMEESEKRRFLSSVAEANQIVARGVGRDSGFNAAANLTVLVARVAAVAAGGLLAIRGEITVGTVVAFLGYVGGLFVPVQGLSGIYQTLQRARVSLEEILAILDAPGRVTDRRGARSPARARGEIELEEVRFSYHPAAPPVLDGVTLRVAPGETVALVGPSGSGKSTLASLVLRLHEAERGTVRVDGIDIRMLRERWIRRHVAVVLQEPLLFDDTVAANIAYGKPGASMRQIEAAARAAHAHEFISRLPDAYGTRVGERGARLSVGERQRVTLARALVKDAPILVLDEATSALDAESEALVQEALERLMRGRSVLVIAHRLATVARADRIAVLDGGRVAETGTHSELLQREGIYASLVRRQTRGLLPLHLPAGRSAA
ncbi:MAG TPA: ABC transporter ATP-binding protein [Candidatus Eisenbacteria bacterium]|nr:ABC transporter ATP-binding protein [Candidatus Eisenbacteria bacterium]